MIKERMLLPELMDATETRMVKLNYSSKTMYSIRCLWRDLLSYAAEKGTNYFSAELGENYLLERFKIDVWSDETAVSLPKCKIKRYKRAIALLADFQNEGVVKRAKNSSRTEIPERYIVIVDHYLNTVRERNNSEGTVVVKKLTVKSFLLHLEQKEIYDLKRITDREITSFLKTTISWSKRTVATTICYLRQFLSFLYEEKYIETDLAKHMPTPNHGRGGKLPNVWSPVEIDKILSSVDRANPVGKRDYAILLLVTQLGLRDSDVQNLMFSNLLWKECRIKFTQTKTKRSLELPLTEETGGAIIDYLKYGRPKQDTSEFVFVRHCAPYGKCINYYHIMKAYLRKAGVQFDTEKSHGLHTLRHTLATRLLEQDIPLPTISEILGHASVASTKVYLQIDIDGLRKCALNPNEVYENENSK